MIKGFQIDFSDNVVTNSIKRISECIKTGQVSSGKNIDLMESTAASITGVKYVSAVSNGSDGLEICLSYLKKTFSMNSDICQFDVLVPTNTFMATLEAIVRQGFRPVLVDLDSETFGMDLEMADKIIDIHTIAVVPVHIGGLIDPKFESFCKRMKARGIYVIEDACHSFGSRPSLSGDVAVASFFATKVFTGGEGGLVFTNNKDIHNFVRAQRNFGKSDPWVTFHEKTGWNYRINEFSACLIDEQLKEHQKILDVRRHIASQYIKLLGSSVIGYNLSSERNTFYKVIYKTNRLANDIKNELNDYISFPGGVYDIPLHKQPCYKTVYGNQSFPKAEYFCQHHLALPIYGKLSKKDIKFIANKIMEVDNVKS